MQTRLGCPRCRADIAHGADQRRVCAQEENAQKIAKQLFYALETYHIVLQKDPGPTMSVTQTLLCHRILLFTVYYASIFIVRMP